MRRALDYLKLSSAHADIRHKPSGPRPTALSTMEDSTMLDGSQALFHDLVFTIIPTALDVARMRQLEADISACGGSIFPFDASSGRMEDLQKVTHIISTTSDFPDYYRALDLLIHVVKPQWVDACLKISKVKNPRVYSPDPALFMNEVVICCGNIPEGDKEAIEGGVIASGGQYTITLSKQVTHLIALDVDDQRVQLAVSKRLQICIVLPHWFDDCLKVGRRISERPYTLPNPEVLNIEAGAMPSSRPSPQIRDATNPYPTSGSLPPTPAALEKPRAIRAFNGKKVVLAEDLQLNDNLKGVITGLILAGGGKVTTNLDEAHIYVCNYREGEDYIKSSQQNKDVGNLSWLYYLITHDTWTNPMRRMMHYPRPRDGIPNFKNYRVSISSYTGEARVYLENLVKASGAEFTKTFKQDNTHLITAHKQSEKCEAAEEWGVHVVNHLWLEESYSKCKEQSLTAEKYTVFPSRTNLGEILGQTEIDRDAVEKTYFPKHGKPKAVKAIAEPNGVPGSSAPKARPNSGPVAHSSPLAQKNRRTKTTGDVATPVASRFNEKENVTPGSRGAKDRALTKLHDSAPDIAKFEKEMKRKGGVIHGGRREKDAEAGDGSKKPQGRDSMTSKRSIDEVDEEDEDIADDLTEEPTKKNKKAKKDKLTPIKYRMLISKDERWLNNPDKESKDKARLRELGLFITEDAKKVDILCAPKGLRTKKFVSAIASAPIIVATSFLDSALKTNKLPSPEKHILADIAFEKTHGFRLKESLERAKQNKHRLLKDWTIFCTPGVAGGYDTFKDIIAANGGQCHKWLGRTTHVTASKRTIDLTNKEVSQNQEEDEGDVLYLISEAKKSEVPLWIKFRELAKKHNMVPRIVKTEWVLFVTMAQYVHWDPEWELSEEDVDATKS
ncbi:hypothetical protein BDV95DRAFT_576694 [Massariosphaeria phaeospora]|uniref:BRCT domain-containing protein n=1 Tax=Massariosphaeria phaeospora TaxID=100035 RepID=A0A7C8MLL9_9PLEO|nr:hypothetical protein BDV95DRAFT_576694 [Massariosphaeria phaeospora]